MNRNQKLQTLKQRNSKIKRQAIEERKALVDKLDEKMQRFQILIDQGIEIKNGEVLTQEIKSLSPAIEKLESTIANSKPPQYPKSLKIDNIEELKDVLKPHTADLSPIKEVSKEISKLSKKIAEIKAEKAGQKPEDYVPFRRVVKVDGQGLKYDDSFYVGGGGGGSSIPTINGAVPIVNPDGSSISVSTTTTNYATRVDDTTTENVTYLGKASIGSATSGALWQIQKIDETAGTIITWADGNDSFDNIWDNRASLTYS